MSHYTSFFGDNSLYYHVGNTKPIDFKICKVTMTSMLISSITQKVINYKYNIYVKSEIFHHK
jgi:hypothetical protein